jgi:hypothetical protein
VTKDLDALTKIVKETRESLGMAQEDPILRKITKESMIENSLNLSCYSKEESKNVDLSSTMDNNCTSNSWMLLILICKKLKFMIEQTYNIEKLLENNSYMTKEMQYYADIYEIEYSLRQGAYKSDLESIARNLDQIIADLAVRYFKNKNLGYKKYGSGTLTPKSHKSNILLQLEYLKYINVSNLNNTDVSLVLPNWTLESTSVYDSQILWTQSNSVSLYQKLP